MADIRGKQLPNLKISVENTESSNESEEELDFIDDTEDTVPVTENKQSEESEDEGEIDKDDVEFNVRISSHLEPKNNKEKNIRSRRRSQNEDKLVTKEASDVSSNNVVEKQRLHVLPEKRLYENKQGSFVTGIDVVSKDAQAKREQRAKRFRIQTSADPMALKDDIQSLYASLGVRESDFNNEEKGIRGEALHLRGTDNMKTEDVFQYFSEFPGRFIEWINDTSCNVVWEDKTTPVRALLKLTRSHDEVEIEEKKRLEKEESERKSEKQSKKKKQLQTTDSENKEDKPGDQSNRSAPPHSAAAAVSSKKSSSRSTEEKMEVDEDELDLMVDDDDTFMTATSKEDLTAEKGGRATTQRSAAIVKAKKDAGKSFEMTLKTIKKEKEEETKKKKKKELKEKDKRNNSDSDSSSSSSNSSSGSGSSSSSSSSSSSGSDSDSSSSSGSSSDSSSSSSSSDSESEGEERKSKRKSLKKSKRDADRDEVVKGGQHQRRKKHGSIPWPPGKWRLGVPCAKAKCLFIRYATKVDKKEQGAEKKSQFYRKYGNPNYGGIRGLISNSRKRRIHNEKIDKILKSQCPDARKAIDEKRANRKPHSGPVREEGEVSNEDEDIFAVEGAAAEDERIERWPSRREEAVPKEKPKDLRQLLKQSTVAPLKQLSRDEGRSPLVADNKRQRLEVKDEEELDLDVELQQLMEDRPARKRPMGRMYADEEEEKIRARRNRTGLLTVVASERNEGVHSRLTGRLGGRLQLPAERETSRGRQGEESAPSWDPRFPNSEEDEEDLEEEEVEELDDFARELRDYRRLRNIPQPKSSIQPKITAARASFRAPAPTAVDPLSDEDEEDDAMEAGGGDLRSRLHSQARGKRTFPSMRIEVFDDDNDD